MERTEIEINGTTAITNSTKPFIQRNMYAYKCDAGRILALRIPYSDFRCFSTGLLIRFRMMSKKAKIFVKRENLDRIYYKTAFRRKIYTEVESDRQRKF